jgi:lipopolysaccharide export system protein LptC
MAIQAQLPTMVRQGHLPRSADRSKAFRAALRHTSRVRFLKVVLPLGAALISGLYFIPTSLKIETKVGTVDIKNVDLSKDGLKMTNPKLSGVHEKHGAYIIEAESATQNVKQPEFVTLHKIKADLTAPAGGKTQLTAPGGFYHSKKEELTFDKGVDIGGDAGMSGHLRTATAYIQNHVLISADPVEFAYHDSTIKALSMTIYTNESRVIFTGNVQVHLERQPKPSKPPKEKEQ